MRTVLFVTAIRSEYDILFSVMKAVQAHPSLDLKVVVAGAHLSPMYGYTVCEIEKDEFPITARIESLLNSDSYAGRVKSAAIQLMGFVDSFTQIQPAFVIAPMDREEAITTALTGAYLNIPVVHIGGGDTAENGHIDNSVRHAVTKLSHLHMVTTNRSRDRVIALGEEAWRVHVVGAPGLDRLITTPDIAAEDLWGRMGFNPGNQPYAVVIQHPNFPDIDQAGELIRITLQCNIDLNIPTFVSYPNSDAGSQQVIAMINDLARQYPNLIHAYKNLSRIAYVNLLRHAHVFIGNSSSGIVEAPSLKLPVVHVGTRQVGREHAENVQFVDHDPTQIKAAILKAIFDSDYRKFVADCVNPYGDGHAGEKIAKILAEIPLTDQITQKVITY
jgi:GDP/UDP-N,N'-diacetylbacillosamine 2-epimerase (hydrolysing)